MSLVIEVQGLFSPQAIAQTFERLSPLESAIINTLFPAKVNRPFPHIGIGELEAVVGTQPVVRRDGLPVPFSGGGDETNFFAPRPIKPSVTITASEINDLKGIWGNRAGKQQFVERKIDHLRRVIHNTTEAMCSVVATTGKLIWPSRIHGGGSETYELDFGGIKTVALAAKWSESNIPAVAQVYRHLASIRKQISRSGGSGGKVCFLAGEKAFEALLAFAEKWTSTAEGGPIKFALEDGKITIGSFVIQEVAEEYQEPLGGAWVPKVPPKAILAYASQRKGEINYLAVDSMSANGEASQFHIVVEKLPGDVGLNLIAQAKPLPVIDVRSLALSEVVE